jgi:hypothetical protein
MQAIIIVTVGIAYGVDKDLVAFTNFGEAIVPIIVLLTCYHCKHSKRDDVCSVPYSFLLTMVDNPLSQRLCSLNNTALLVDNMVPDIECVKLISAFVKSERLPKTCDRHHKQ